MPSLPVFDCDDFDPLSVEGFDEELLGALSSDGFGALPPSFPNVPYNYFSSEEYRNEVARQFY